jgi:hypothetical protein
MDALEFFEKIAKTNYEEAKMSARCTYVYCGMLLFR